MCNIWVVTYFYFKICLCEKVKRFFRLFWIEKYWNKEAEIIASKWSRNEQKIMQPWKNVFPAYISSAKTAILFHTLAFHGGKKVEKIMFIFCLCFELFLLRERSSDFFFLVFFLFLNFSRGHFSNLKILTILTIFLDRFNGLLFKWDIIILFSGFVPPFSRFFPDFLQILRFLQFWPYFFTQLMGYFSNLTW